MPAVSHSALIARLALALVALALLPATARAATFTVNTTSDGTVACTVVVCTLRAALTAANGNGAAEDDVITVPAGQYLLSPQLPPLTVNGGQRIAFRGAGANSTVIVPQTDASFRLLAINGAAQVAISDITLRGGTVTSGTGGNLDIAGGANVTLDRVRVGGRTGAAGRRHRDRRRRPEHDPDDPPEPDRRELRDGHDDGRRAAAGSTSSVRPTRST